MQIQNQAAAAQVFWGSLRQVQPQQSQAAQEPAKSAEPAPAAPAQAAQAVTPNLFVAPQPAGPLPQRGSTINILV